MQSQLYFHVHLNICIKTHPYQHGSDAPRFHFFTITIKRISFGMKNGFSSYLNFDGSQHRSFDFASQFDVIDKMRNIRNGRQTTRNTVQVLHYRVLQLEKCILFPSLTIATIEE